MSKRSSSNSNVSSGGGRWGNAISVCFSIIVILTIVVGFISFGPIDQIRNPLCKITHIKFFCRGIIDVQPVKVGPDTLDIGLSEGNYAFDIRDPNGKYKQQAVEDMKAGRTDDAVKDWKQAINLTTDDAESMIYIENKLVADSHKPYVTIVVTTTLSQTLDDSGTSISVARDDLRGAYWAQRDFNAQHSDLKIRLVLANLGVKAQNYLQKTEEPVLQRIIRLAQTDDTFIGIVGFPFSASAQIAIPVLTEHHIPIISPSASSKDLSNLSTYFFRIVPSDTKQGQYAAQFASQVLAAHRVAVLSDNADPYSESLGDSFATSFSQLGSGYTVISKNFSLGNSDSLSSALNDIFSQNPPPDLIFLAGYADDLNSLKSELTQLKSNILVMGGDASYELGGYSPGNYSNFYFAAFTYPDTWDILCPSNTNCATLRPSISNSTTYAATFDPKKQHPGEYGYARPGTHVLLAYDATRALILAASSALSPSNGGVSISREAVRDALQHVSFLGASGQISFDGSDPANKSVVMLCIDHNHHTQLTRVYEQFALGAKDSQLDPDYIKYKLCA